MSQAITIPVPDHVARVAAQVAERSQRSIEDVLAEWLDRISSDIPVELLPDEEVLALTELQLGDEEQAIFSSLLEKNREGALSAAEQLQLDEMMRVYEHGLLRKAQALRVAVQRGLREPLQP